ncbi:MAG: CD1247 N-terminal domain-containing protein [Candidatus Heteroscillospira sp.]|jgi:hypothetical protein
MNISEKVAYLRGLAKGLDVSDSKEGQLIEVITDILEDIAANLAEIEDNALDLGEEIDVLSDDLESVENLIYDDEDDDDDDDDDECCCGGDCCCDEDEEYPLFFEVTCPSCENTITIDEDVLNLGTIQCPNCGEMLEFDLDSIEEEDEESESDSSGDEE